MTWRHLLLAKCMIHAQPERLACPSSSPAAMLGNEVAFRDKLDQHVWCNCSSHWAPRRQQVLCHCSPLHAGNISVNPRPKVALVVLQWYLFSTPGMYVQDMQQQCLCRSSIAQLSVPTKILN